jgi:hypothetical protein
MIGYGMQKCFHLTKPNRSPVENIHYRGTTEDMLIALFNAVADLSRINIEADRYF